MKATTTIAVVHLGFGECPKLVIPIGFQRVSDESIVGVDLHIALSRKIRLILHPFDPLTPKTIGLVNSILKLLLDGQRNIERHR